MRRRTNLVAFLVGAMVLSAGCSGAGAPVGTGGIMQRPADPQAAVHSEYRRAKATGTRAALELFIARHPDHPMARQAEAEIRRRYG